MLALYGAASGPVPPLDLVRLSTMGSLFITRPISFDYVRTHDELTSVTGNVFGMFSGGQLNVPISSAYPLEDAAQSHRDLESEDDRKAPALNWRVTGMAADG
jgi:NADPH:quinone reductase